MGYFYILILTCYNFLFYEHYKKLLQNHIYLKDFTDFNKLSSVYIIKSIDALEQLNLEKSNND